MDKGLKEYLREGERPLWHGTPLPFPMMDRSHKNKLILRWILTVVCSCALMFLYGSNNANTSATFLLMVTATAVILCLSPLWEYASLRAQEFWITNQRAILRLKGKNYRYMELEDIDEFRILDHVADHPCLTLGGCLFPDVLRQIRWQGCHPKTTSGSGATGRVIGMVFYCSSQLDEAVSLLEHLKDELPKAG